MIDIRRAIQGVESLRDSYRSYEDGTIIVDFVTSTLEQQKAEINDLTIARDFSISRNKRLEFALNKCKNIMDTQQDTIKLLKGEV